MPAFTQDELNEFANVGTVGDTDELQQSADDMSADEGDERVLDSSTIAETKHEFDADVQDIPAEGSVDSPLKEELVEEFAEATEHLSPQDELEQQDEQQDTDGDVTMEDAAENQNTPEPDAEEQSDAEVNAEGRGAEETASDSESHRADSSDAQEDKDEESEASDDTASESATDSESESEAESASEDGDNEEEHVDEEETVTGICVVCQEPADDSEADNFLECTQCGKYAHLSCASNYGVFKETGSSRSWQCPKCVQMQHSESPREASKRNRNSAPRLVRDLLPVSRGVQKPNSHSIFAQPLISEGEDGGRALRKRKSPTVEPPVSDKRRRKATPKALSATIMENDLVAHTTRRMSQKPMPTARILQYRPYEKAPPHKFILAFRLDQSKIEKILNKQPRPGRRRDRRRPPKIPPPPIFQPPVPKFPALPTNHLIFPSMWGDRDSEASAKPYGGILTDIEADTSRSLPQLRDREMFEIARKEAEEERRKTSAAAEAEINGDYATAAKPNRTVSGPPSRIKCIQFGKHVIDTFYAAPYPEEYSHESRLFICEFCLKYLPSEFVAYRHKLKCPAKHPPGDEIYRDGSISIWEVDGRKKTEYCQCLCLMAKMFLGSKTLYYDVEPFLFYILTEYDEFGYHFVGYFSKEKRPASQNNVSCILVMPIHQRKGYATFLIDFSYLLTRIEGKDGSPEKPLSDMGLTAYRSYWDLTISKQLLEIGLKPFSTKDLMQRTGMTADDVVHSLERLYAFVKDPVTKTYAIRYDEKLYTTIVSDFEGKKYRKMNPDHLIWTPYIMGRSDQAHLETQPVQTIAPREAKELAVEDVEDRLSKSKDGNSLEEEANVSPKTSHDVTQSSLASANDPRLINESGHIAPGPPSAQLLTGSTANNEAQANGNGVDTETAVSKEELTGYALVYRDYNIPPNRFQIDPPIPASMLRARSHKKRNTGFGRRPANGDSAQLPNSMTPVRSSPRHAASTNGSINGTDFSPEKPSTPVRRSSRKSRLSNVENAGLDGSIDPTEHEIGEEMEAKVGVESDSEGSSEHDEDDSIEGEDEDREDDDQDEDDDDDVELPEDEDEDEDDESEEPDDDDPDALDIAGNSDESEESDE